MENTYIVRQLGMIVRNRRKQLGITQTKSAPQADLHGTYICDVEHGHRNVTLQIIEKLARALDVPIEVLFSKMSRSNDSINLKQGQSVSRKA